MNITEAHDVALVLQHMTGATNTDRKPEDVVDAALRLTVRAGSALQVAPWKIASGAEIEQVVAELAQQQADDANYLTDYADVQ